MSNRRRWVCSGRTCNSLHDFYVSVAREDSWGWHIGNIFGLRFERWRYSVCFVVSLEWGCNSSHTEACIPLQPRRTGEDVQLPNRSHAHWNYRLVGLENWVWSRRREEWKSWRVVEECENDLWCVVDLVRIHGWTERRANLYTNWTVHRQMTNTQVW